MNSSMNLDCKPVWFNNTVRVKEKTMAALRVEPGSAEYDKVKAYVEAKEAEAAAKKALAEIKDEVKDLVVGAGEVILDDKVLTIKTSSRTNVAWKGVEGEALKRCSKKNQAEVDNLKEGSYTTTSEVVSVVIADYEAPKGASAAADAFGSKE